MADEKRHSTLDNYSFDFFLDISGPLKTASGEFANIGVNVYKAIDGEPRYTGDVKHIVKIGQTGIKVDDKTDLTSIIEQINAGIEALVNPPRKV